MIMPKQIVPGAGVTLGLGAVFGLVTTGVGVGTTTASKKSNLSITYQINTTQKSKQIKCSYRNISI